MFILWHGGEGWLGGGQRSSWISPKPPPAMQKHQSKTDSSDQMGSIWGVQGGGTLGGLSEEPERGSRLLLFPGVLCISNKENAKTEL